MPIKSSLISDYLQPDFYHFNRDSIYLSKRAAELLGSLGEQRVSLVDGFCGCGVVALEILKVNNFHNIKLYLK